MHSIIAIWNRYLEIQARTEVCRLRIAFATKKSGSKIFLPSIVQTPDNAGVRSLLGSFLARVALLFVNITTEWTYRAASPGTRIPDPSEKLPHIHG
jgi:hypothetical protein